MILIIRERATPEQMIEMMRPLRTYIKLAVDVQREIVAGGGFLHADCEALLLEDGSLQEYVWVANWIPLTQEVTYESPINIRPRHNNRSMEIGDPSLRTRVEKIVRRLLEGV